MENEGLVFYVHDLTAAVRWYAHELGLAPESVGTRHARFVAEGTVLQLIQSKSAEKYAPKKKSNRWIDFDDAFAADHFHQISLAPAVY